MEAPHSKHWHLTDYVIEHSRGAAQRPYYQSYDQHSDCWMDSEMSICIGSKWHKQ